MQGIPTNMRNLKSSVYNVTYRTYTSLDKSKTLVFTVFKASLKQKLHTKTNAKQRLSACAFFFYNLIKTAITKLSCRILKCAYTGEYYSVGFSYHVRIRCYTAMVTLALRARRSMTLEVITLRRMP